MTYKLYSILIVCGQFKEMEAYKRTKSHLHFKRGLALVHTIGGSTTCPQVCKALHGEGSRTITVSGHLEVQVTVVYANISKENANLF